MTVSFSHQPEGYECPFCRIWGIERPDQGTKQRDIIYQNEKVTAFIAGKWWPNNKGHVLTVPNQHFENIFELLRITLLRFTVRLSLQHLQ